MHIGILTLHFGYNQGAVLQAYCLAKNLSTAFPHAQVEIVDYRHRAKIQIYGPSDDPRKKATHQFIENDLPRSRRCFIANTPEAAFRFIQDTYDLVVVGSDEVWRTNYYTRLNGWVTCQERKFTPAFPSVYWPNTKIQAHKVAYAAAVGHTSNWDKIPKRHHEKMKEYLADFALLGVRDRKTHAYLKWLDEELGQKAEWVPDPTFSYDALADVDRQHLLQKLTAWGVDFTRPRLGLTVVRESPSVDQVIQLARRQNFQIITLEGSRKQADVSLEDKALTPLEWAATFKFFDISISQSMHGCVFSILNGTPCIGMNVRKDARGYATKIEELFQLFGLENFYADGNDPHSSLPEIWHQFQAGAWPTDQVEKKIGEFKSRAAAFTAKIVKSCGTE